MEATNTTIEPIGTVICPVCKNPIDAEGYYCSSCGYPRLGTEHERRVFILKRKTLMSRLEEANKMLRQASNTMLIIGGIITVFAVGTYLWGANGVDQGDLGSALSRLSLGLAFLALGIWCLKRPLPAIISGFSLFFIAMLVNAFLSPATIFHFIIAKVAIVIFMANGLRAVFSAEKLKKELNG
jgi:hypothetical protein